MTSETGRWDRSAVFNEIKGFIESLDVTRKSITPDSQVYHDLGLRGTDAYELLQFVESKFSVDFAGFRFKRYFHGEYFGVKDIIRYMFGIYDESKARLTVGHLVDVAMAGEWHEPNSENKAK